MVRLESLHTETHSPHPLHNSLLILISGLSFVLDVGIAIVFPMFFIETRTIAVLTGRVARGHP